MLTEGVPSRHFLPSTLRPRTPDSSATYQSPTTPSKLGDGAPSASSLNGTKCLLGDAVPAAGGADEGKVGTAADALVATGALGMGDGGAGTVAAGLAVGRSQPRLNVASMSETQISCDFIIRVPPSVRRRRRRQAG